VVQSTWKRKALLKFYNIDLSVKESKWERIVLRIPYKLYQTSVAVWKVIRETFNPLASWKKSVVQRQENISLHFSKKGVWWRVVSYGLGQDTSKVCGDE